MDMESAERRPTRFWATGARLLIVALLSLPACQRASSPPATSAVEPAPRASVALKVLVVNDLRLAEAINRLRGEWAERTGGSLTAESVPWADVAASEKIDADLVIFSTQYLSELTDSKRLRPMRESALTSRSYDAADVLPLARRKLGHYGGRTMALPLAIELPLVAGAADTAAGENNASETIWPTRDLVANWSAIVLLARAAGYATHPRQEAVLFDPQTMDARIAEPPFVRALEEWKQEVTADPSGAGTHGGEAVMWSEFPGTSQVFNRSTATWEPIEGGSRRVPLIAGGQLMAVTASSRNATSAFDLAIWLASGEIGRQIGPIGQGALPVRRSLLGTAGRWVDSSTGNANGPQIAKVLQSALSRDEVLVVPRIPGSNDYLAALAAAVDRVLQGNATAADALREAASEWNRLTDTKGRDAQRQAYLADLGITGQ